MARKPDFSCKLNIDPALWDEKTNYLKSQRNTLSREIHQMLENIKAQIAKHYQSICDRDAYVTANKVKKAYHGFGDQYKTLIEAFDYHADSIKARIGRDRAQRTYDKLMEERRCLVRYLVLKKLEDVTLKELDVAFIERYYAWLLSDGNCGKTTAFKRTQTLKHLICRRRAGLDSTVIPFWRSNALRITSPACSCPTKKYKGLWI